MSLLNKSDPVKNSQESINKYEIPINNNTQKIKKSITTELNLRNKDNNNNSFNFN